MELFASLNDYTGGLLAVILIAGVVNFLSQRRRLDRMELLQEQLVKTLADPRVGLVPRVEFEGHRDETRQRLQRVEGKVSWP